MLKFGFWQIVELFTVVYSLINTFYKHGKPAMSQKELDNYNNLPDDLKVLSAFIIFCLFMILGPMIAYFGGCSGIYFIAYSIVCVLMYLYGMLAMQTGDAVSIKHSFTWNVLLMSVYNYLLYMGGFWSK